VSDIILRVVGIVACCACAFLARWIYLHPERFLEKFLGKGISHGRAAFIWAKSAGALWLSISVYAILVGMSGWLLEEVVSTGFFIAIYVPLSALITWQLLKTRTARP
jgi:hypothetical protein